MSRLPIFFRWLTIAALADWLITRTVTRSAIFMPKSPPVIAVYQALGLGGQFASVLTGLCVILAVSWIAWRSLQARREFDLVFVLLSLLAMSIEFLFFAPAARATVAYQLLVIAAVVTISWRVWVGAGDTGNKIAWTIPASAIVAGELYQLSHALYAAMRWPGPPPFAAILFNLGELFAVLSPIVLWWVYGRVGRSARSTYVWAAIPALTFAVAYLANPAMTAIIAIWSTGLTLYLPWPLYAGSLWLASAIVITSLGRGDTAGWAILLLAAGGYTPQLSTQVLLGLIALWLLTPALAALDFDGEMATVSGLRRRQSVLNEG